MFFNNQILPSEELEMPEILNSDNKRLVTKTNLADVLNEQNGQDV